MYYLGDALFPRIDICIINENIFFVSETPSIKMLWVVPFKLVIKQGFKNDNQELSQEQKHFLLSTGEMCSQQIMAFNEMWTQNVIISITI